MEGANWSGDHLALNDGSTVRLSASQLRWVQQDPSKAGQRSLVNLPVYLNGDRSDVLFTVDLPFQGAASSMASMRAVCLTAG